MPQIVEVPGMGEVEFPDDMSSDQIEQAIRSNMQQQPQLSPTQMEEAPVMAQIGRGMMDVYQGGKQLALNTADFINNADKTIDEIFSPGSFTNKAAKSIFSALAEITPEVDAKAYNKQLSEELALYNRNNPDFQGWRVLGSVATPLTLIPGAGASTLGGKIVAGAATGGIFSMLQPADDPEGHPDEYWAQKGEQALWGAGTGAALPVAGKIVGATVSWLDEMTKPLYQHGIYRDVSKFLKESVTENKDRITKAIQRAIASGDDRTVGQIIADANRGSADDFGGMLVRLEKDLSRHSDSLKSLYARQSVGRRAVLDSLAGSDDDLARAIATRESNGANLYAQAFAQKVKLDDEISGILNNDYGKKAISEAIKVAEAKGVPRTNNSEILHYVKLGLDKELSKTGDLALSKAERGAVKQVKDNLVGWIEKRNPFYRDARIQYQIDSLPINRMEVARELRNSFVTSLDNDSPARFATSLRDAHKVIKKTGGDPRYTSMSDLFSPEELDSLKNISEELSVQAKQSKMATTSESLFKNLKGEVTVQLPHILERNIVITNAILKKLGSDKTPEYRKLLVKLIQNPDDFIRAYGGPSSDEKTKIAQDIVRRLATITTAQQGAQDLGE